MNLKELIARLEREPPAKRLKHGFNNPHSYRGDYFELAFDPVENITVGEMLAAAKEALGSTYQGWKGGEFTMNEVTECHIAEEGDWTGNDDDLPARLLEYMLADEVKAP